MLLWKSDQDPLHHIELVQKMQSKQHVTLFHPAALRRQDVKKKRREDSDTYVCFVLLPCYKYIATSRD